MFNIMIDGLLLNCLLSPIRSFPAIISAPLIRRVPAYSSLSLPPVRAFSVMLRAAICRLVVPVGLVTIVALCTMRADVTRTYHGVGIRWGLRKWKGVIDASP